MVQQTFDENKEDEFIKSLNLTEEKIIEDLESMRNIEGFPIGDVEDIMELSEPPYYTAYPNPYIKDFIKYYGNPYDEKTDDYSKNHYTGDIIEGKNDPIYRAHSYHTKVPPKAIIQFIEHYTNPGDLVFDGFSGSGMTGVASLLSNRNCISTDISSAACFLAYNYNSKVNLAEFESVSNKIFQELDEKCGWMFQTTGENGEKGFINYVVWSDEFICPHCGFKFTYWDVAVDMDGGKINKEYSCPNCDSLLNNKNVIKSTVDLYDDLIGENVKQENQIPVFINYSIGKKRLNKKLDEEDFNLIKQIQEYRIPYWVPTNELPIGYNTKQPIKSHGFANVHHFYSRRNLIILATFNELIKKYALNNHLKVLMTAVLNRNLLKCNKFIINKHNPKGRINGPLSGTLYIPPLVVEQNGIELIKYKKKDIVSMFNFEKKSHSLVSNQSSTDLKNIPKNSIDYIFIDPPFGANIMYSEMNFLWESWLKSFTNNKDEAIVNKFQNKESEDYKNLMESCFKEFFRILKPNRWITIEFHNSKAEIWKIIQKAIIKSGFSISHVAVLNKVQGTIHQDSKVDTAVKNDLVINAYKPTESFSDTFLKTAGLNMELEFIKMHLKKLPILDYENRNQYTLYSRLLAYYLQNNFEVRIDSIEFYNILQENFIERDGLWFNSDQVSQYEKELKLKNISSDYGDSQDILGIFNEKDLIIWLKNFLKVPRDYDEIYTEFSKRVMVLDDLIPELKSVLDENFVIENKKYRLPSNLEKKSMEEKRSKLLIKEFYKILEDINSKSKIEEVRKEALFTGLMQLYKEKDVDTIKLIGERIDSRIIESDDDISAIIDWAKYK